MRLKVSRQACGAFNGSKPSNISIKPMASNMVELNLNYNQLNFFAATIT